MTPFTKALAAISLLGAAISAALLVTTFFAQGLIIRKARGMALDATVPKLQPVVETLRKPALLGMLPPKVKQKLDEELTAYEASPETWLLEIAEGNRHRAAAFEFPEVRNPLARKALDSINRKVSGAREHFSRSYTNLIRDVRIFCGTNAVALLTAAWLLRVAKTKTMRHWLGAWSVMLMVATGTGVWLYVNQDWLRSFLFNDYYGWSYLAINLGVAVYLFLRAQPTLWATRPKMD